MRIVVAGVGNILRGDDGFGVRVAQQLLERSAPPDVLVMDVGIGGIHLVQELLATPAEALIVVDAMELDRPPGTLAVLRPDVADVGAMSLSSRHDALADMHYATPERALMLAQGLRVLPATVWLLGCQPADADRIGEGLTPPLEAALGAACAEVQRLVEACGVAWG